MRWLLDMVVVVVVLGVAPAHADIRINRPAPTQTPAPTTPPATEPRPEGRGCAGREMASEWLFGLGLLALGLRGMRQRGRAAVTA